MTSIGLDYRPALVNAEGIGRAVRETVRAHASNGTTRLELFGSTLTAPRVPTDELGLGPNTRLSRWRLPSRVWGPLHACTGLGADRLLRGVDLFHHTQPTTLPIARAVETATVWDCLWKDGGSGWIAPEVARRMEASARSVVERCARIQVPSRHVRDEVIDVLGADPGSIDVVGLGGDHVLRVQPDFTRVPERPFLLTAARVDPRKNHVAVLEALQLLEDRGCDLDWVVVGPPGYGVEIFERALERSPVRSRVDWRHAVSDAELVALYARTACFVFPSLGEGFGLPPIEAAFLGAPIVSSGRGSLDEVLPPDAVRVEPEDPHGIANGILDRLGRGRRTTTDGLPRWEQGAAEQRASWRRALEQA
ncbi:MAG: glycosyltransferase family 4 protein [Planctomycetota bacterium]|jgi:glycosyltransferase involved in cell wall biosynthesis